jgi:putative transposase
VLNRIRALFFAALALFQTRRQLAAEVLALRHQLGVLRRSVKRPRLTNIDRGLWALLSRRWSRWSDALIIVKPATVIKWHRTGFRWYWTWRSFLDNHLDSLVSVDFFTVPTVFFHVLFVFVVLAHDRRRILSINVTRNPSAAWAANQVVQAFPWDSTPRYLLRDRDGIYGAVFRNRVGDLVVKEVVIAPRSPWQSPFVERVIGTLRRELLDHVVVLNERHLRRLLRRFVAEYCHTCRTHLSPGKDAPEPRAVEPPERGEVAELPVVGGLHHLYTRRAA